MTQVSAAPQASWTRDARRARLLAWASLGWMTVEGAVGIGAGVAAGSIALVGFGLDSAIEGFASLIVIWRFTGERTLSETSERRAQRAVAVSFLLLAPYVAFESLRDLVTGSDPQTSWVGVALAISSLVLMPLLARAKHQLGQRLDSAATAAEGTQNLLCAYLAAAVLVGLLGNALFGAAWLDPVAGLFIAAVAANEGRELWQGDDCGCH
jgi:divalent metal cation (Fe/Co/Zn/Cd) transporter